MGLDRENKVEVNDVSKMEVDIMKKIKELKELDPSQVEIIHQ